jgi:peptidoglycan/xylan/chitin deacetylase (PgdA/CDA1 family)
LSKYARILCGIVAVSLLSALGSGCRRAPVATVKAPQPTLPIAHTNHQPPTTEHPTLLAALKPNPRIYESYPDKTEQVALTFDAGSDDGAVSLLLKTLAEHHVHTTFFLTGKFCEQYPKSCRAIADAGMEIGNHSYSHPYFTKLSRDAILAQLTRGEAAIVKACGRGAKPLFRFPYGDCDRRTRAIVAAAGYQPVGWSLDSLDSVGQHKSADYVVGRILRKIHPGYITLMHVSMVDSARSLPRIFAYLDQNHLQVVPVSQLLLASIDADALKQLKARQRGKSKVHGKMQAARAVPLSVSPSQHTVVR